LAARIRLTLGSTCNFVPIILGTRHSAPQSALAIFFLMGKKLVAGEQGRWAEKQGTSVEKHARDIPAEFGFFKRKNKRTKRKNVL
jgi:hypothetical protein